MHTTAKSFGTRNTTDENAMKLEACVLLASKRTVFDRGRHWPTVTMSPSFTFSKQGEQ